MEPFKRKRGTPALAAKPKMGRKRALVHQRLSSLDNGSGRSKHVDDDDGFDPTRKRGRPVGSISTKIKKEDKPMLVDNSSCKIKTENDNDFHPEVYINTTDGASGHPSLDTSVGRNISDGDGIRSSDPEADFNAVKSFRDFNVIIDGLVIDRELLPDRQRWTYYELCCARKVFLHRYLPKQISPLLAAEVIVETVNIAEAIRTCHASSSLEDLATWKTILEAFEILGMDVAFLRKRVDDLHVAMEQCRPYEAVKKERDLAAEKMRSLESKMSSLNDALKELDMEVEEMESIVKKMKKDQAMWQLATAPW